MPIRDCPIIPHPAGKNLIVLPLRIINPDTKLAIGSFGVIDTGASSCSLPLEIAVNLGLKPTGATPTEIKTGSGTAQGIPYFTTIEIVHPVKLNKVFYTIDNQPINYIADLSAVLLGVEEFLGEFKFFVNYKRGRFSLTH